MKQPSSFAVIAPINAQYALERVYLACLAQASYPIGSLSRAAAVAPQRQVDPYLDAISQHGLHVAHVIETHLHAHLLSARRESADGPFPGRHAHFLHELCKLLDKTHACAVYWKSGHRSSTPAVFPGKRFRARSQYSQPIGCPVRCETSH